jgi:large subunit ribosomal protein L10
MEGPKPEKVAVIDEVRERLNGSTASVVTEYRGLTVADMANLRKNIRSVGGDFKVFKNTLVRRALEGSNHEGLSDFLVGPTAIAFVEGDVSAVAKALKDFADANPALVIKGGVFEGSALSADALKTLANLPSRDVLLARLAGLIASPMQTFAGLMKAVPQSFAYGLQSLIDSKPAEAAPAAEAPAAVEEPAVEEPAGEEAAPAPVADVAPEATEEISEEGSDATGEAAAPEAEASAPAEEVAVEEAPSEEVTAEEAGADAPADEA